jgi:hypothetical protein
MALSFKDDRVAGFIILAIGLVIYRLSLYLPL